MKKLLSIILLCALSARALNLCQDTADHNHLFSGAFWNSADKHYPRATDSAVATSAFKCSLDVKLDTMGAFYESGDFFPKTVGCSLFVAGTITIDPASGKTYKTTPTRWMIQTGNANFNILNYAGTMTDSATYDLKGSGTISIAKSNRVLRDLICAYPGQVTTMGLTTGQSGFNHKMFLMGGTYTINTTAYYTGVPSTDWISVVPGTVINGPALFQIYHNTTTGGLWAIPHIAFNNLSFTINNAGGPGLDTFRLDGDSLIVGGYMYLYTYSTCANVFLVNGKVLSVGGYLRLGVSSAPSSYTALITGANGTVICTKLYTDAPATASPCAITINTGAMVILDSLLLYKHDTLYDSGTVIFRGLATDSSTGGHFWDLKKIGAGRATHYSAIKCRDSLCYDAGQLNMNAGKYPDSCLHYRDALNDSSWRYASTFISGNAAFLGTGFHKADTSWYKFVGANAHYLRTLSTKTYGNFLLLENGTLHFDSTTHIKKLVDSLGIVLQDKHPITIDSTTVLVDSANFDTTVYLSNLTEDATSRVNWAAGSSIFDTINLLNKQITTNGHPLPKITYGHSVTRNNSGAQQDDEWQFVPGANLTLQAQTYTLLTYTPTTWNGTAGYIDTMQTTSGQATIILPATTDVLEYCYMKNLKATTTARILYNPATCIMAGTTDTVSSTTTPDQATVVASRYYPMVADYVDFGTYIQQNGPPHRIEYWDTAHRPATGTHFGYNFQTNKFEWLFDFGSGATWYIISAP